MGFYETYDGHTVTIIDAPCATCSNLDHRVDAVISIDLPETSTVRQERSGAS